MSYPISVVVPTKNRYKYLKKLVELIIGFETDELELVIQDNSDDNVEIVEWLKDKQHKWLKYHFCTDKLTSIQNFDKGICNATGDYVCFIGDDDGVVRNIIDCAKWMKRNNIEALKSIKTSYSWPECHSHSAELMIDNGKHIIEYLNPIKELKKTLETGFREELGNIPVLYTGIVKRTILNKIYEEYGTYFPGGASADVANGVALCFYVKRYVKLNVPVVIIGTSAKTGSVSDRRKFVPFSEISFIAPEVGLNWEGDFPKYWFGCFVWPESAIKSLRAIGKESFILLINNYRIFAKAVLRSGVKPWHYKAFCPSTIKLCWYITESITLKYFKAIIKRFLWRIMAIKGKSRYYSSIENINEAEKKLYTMSINFSDLKYE